MPVTICTGCADTFDGLPLNNTPGILWQIESYLAQGIGQGALNNVTGFPLGTVQIYNLNGASGTCVPITGSISTSGGQFDATGIFTIPQTTTGCTGAVGCSANLQIDFSGNANIWRLVPQAQGTIQIHNFANGTITGVGVVTSGSQNTTATLFDLASANCGFSRFYQIDVRFFIPGFSGSLLSSTSHNFRCLPCITG